MSEPYISEIKIMSFGYAPRGWAQCNGQLLPINQYQTLFALLGTTYGGDGRTTFALPNLQSRAPLHMGNGVALGERLGEATHTIVTSEMPTHNHGMFADGTTPGANNSNTPAPADDKSPPKVLGQSVGSMGVPPVAFGVQVYSGADPNSALNPAVIGVAGGSQPHPNLQPYTVLNFCIALTGVSHPELMTR